MLFNKLTLSISTVSASCQPIKNFAHLFNCNGITVFLQRINYKFLSHILLFVIFRLAIAKKWHSEFTKRSGLHSYPAQYFPFAVFFSTFRRDFFRDFLKPIKTFQYFSRNMVGQ